MTPEPRRHYTLLEALHELRWFYLWAGCLIAIVVAAEVLGDKNSREVATSAFLIVFAGGVISPAVRQLRR